MTTEKELNVNLLRELHHLNRVERVARRENASVEDILEAIELEKSDIMEMLYQKPPLLNS